MVQVGVDLHKRMSQIAVLTAHGELTQHRVPAPGPRVLGGPIHRAKEICLTGDAIDAQEAYRIGIINRVVPPDRLMPEARAIAEKLVAKSPVTLRLIKQAITEGYGLTLEAGLSVEAKTWAIAFATEDRTEGVAAFLEKRTAAFKGR
jgi:enoyl-CoA hydratase